MNLRRLSSHHGEVSVMWSSGQDIMVHPVQTLAAQAEIMTKVGNACYYSGHSSRTSLVTVAVTV